MKETTLGLFKRAEWDNKSAIALYNLGDYNNSCVLSQQCVEKGLKAFIDFKNKRVPKLHNISMLLDTVKSLGVTIPQDIVLVADELTSVYLIARYRGTDLNRHDAEKFVNVSYFVLNWVKSLLS